MSSTQLGGYNFRDSEIHDAARIGNIANIQQLLNAGIPIEELGGDGNTPLMVAAGTGRNGIQAVEFLLTEGANINAANHFGQSALHLACENGSSVMVKYLLDAGAYMEMKTRLTRSTPADVARRNRFHELASFVEAYGSACKALDIINHDSVASPSPL